MNRADELPALAFGSHYFVFKERPGTHLSIGVDAGLPEGLYRTELGPLESLLRLPMDPVGPLGGIATLPDGAFDRQRVGQEFLPRQRVQDGLSGVLVHRSWGFGGER